MLGFLLASFLVGCADYAMVGIKQREPEILVHPAHIDFGSLQSGFESEQKYFTVTNTGDEDLIIGAPVLVSGNERFSLIDSPEEDIFLGAGEMIQVDILYTPETFESNGGYVEIASNDLDEGVVLVTLEGYGDAPVMTVNPPEFDYGLISIGCDNEERVTITNDGNLPLTIDSVTQMVTQPVDIVMEFGSLPEPPWTLDPSISVDFLVSYVPNDIGYDESNIRITGNDPRTPEVEIIQYGDGDIEQWHSQTHLQEEVPVLDVLWVIDDSGSMNRFQTNLSSNIGLFVSTFMATGADYHMSVITTSDATPSPLITSADADPASTLASHVMVGIGGSGIEKGIQFAERALSSVTSVGPGSAFFRNDATLVVIFVSDEADQSDGNWASYLTFFDNLKPAGNFIPYGVIGDYPAGCSISAYNSAHFGAGYWDIIDHYGGDWYSICATDWGVQLQNLADAMTAKRSHRLDEPDPIVSTIEVTVNGQATENWEYDSDTNSVIFAEDHIPTEGQTIVIDYAVWGCDGE